MNDRATLRQQRETNPAKREKGFVLIAVALMLIALLGFVALAVDTGVLYSARTDAQEIADAAAMAGAFTFINTPSLPQPATATSYALGVATANSVMGKPITAGDVTITSDVAKRRVTVSIKATQTTYFAKAIGISSADVVATATAETSQYATGSACVKPWFLPNTALSGGDVCADECNTAKLLIDPTTREVTSFGLSKIGLQFSVKPQEPNDALAPGNFYAIEFPGSPGAGGYRNAIATCDSPYLRCGEKLSVKSGNMVGPTVQGVNSLIGDPPRFSWISPGQYQRQSDSKIFDLSDSVILVPVWSSCGGTFCPSAKIDGQLQIVGWAAVFLEGVSGDYVVGRLVGVSSCGPMIATPETGGTALAVPIRLIRD
jgi:Tfp pilus assembly protein PilX